jgi:hypothetical protein
MLLYQIQGVFMRLIVFLIGKTKWFTINLLFLFVLIPAIYSETFSDEEVFLELQLTGDNDAELTMGSSPFDDEAFFFEELFVLEAVFSFYTAFLGVESFFDDDTFFLEEEKLLAEESFLDDWVFINEFLNEESQLGEETFFDEEILVVEEPLPDEDAFFFEAPEMIFEVPEYEIRSLSDIFPSFSRRQRTLAMSSDGLRRSFDRNESPSIISNQDFGIDLVGNVMKRNPSHLIEALVVVPYIKRELDLLDVYNALGRIENIKNFHSTLNGRDYYVFSESTRIESPRNRRAVSDPLPTDTLPFFETMYLRLNEVDIGNVFLRGEISISMYGITYNMTNFTDIRYFLIPVMRAERFITTIYLEPIKEGILIYSMSGFYLPGFIADRINLTPNVNRRIEVFVKWITDGLRQQENIVVEQDNVSIETTIE